MGKIITSDADCADCLCRVCAHNDGNDSYSKQLEYGSIIWKKCRCGCNLGDEIVDTTDDCSEYLPDEYNE